MSEAFPGTVPELPVSSVARAAAYYEKHLGFYCTTLAPCGRLEA